MKKLKIKNKELFKNQIVTIAMMVLAIIIIVIAGNYLKENGLDSLFTIHAYQEAFEPNPNDSVLIGRFQILFIIVVFALGFPELKYNKEMQDFKRKEEELCGYLLEH